MSFEQLLHVSRICHGMGYYYQYIEEWSIKRQYLALYNNDIPKLVKEYKSAKKETYQLNKDITLIDPIPNLRLSSCCEAVSNCLYSMAAIAAHFGNKISTNNILPKSFNKLIKKYEKGELKDLGLEKCFSDLQWYQKVRELRTEWTHYSTIFIGKDNNNEPLLVVRSFRKASDKKEFVGKINIYISDLVGWINKAISTIDNYGNFLLEKYILPSLELNKKLIYPVYDKNGLLMMKPDKTFEVTEITVEEYLSKCGITKL